MNSSPPEKKKRGNHEDCNHQNIRVVGRINHEIFSQDSQYEIQTAQLQNSTRRMKCFWLLVILLFLGTNAEGLFKFKTETLETFNGARRLLASGTLNTLIDVINKIAETLGVNSVISVPDFGPAANMHKLRWSPKLEHLAFEFGKDRSSVPSALFETVTVQGFTGFEWKGVLLELIQKLLDFLPGSLVEKVLKPVLNILDKFLTALLLMYNYPKTLPMNPDKQLGATEALFAHRYEIGCYAKFLYAVCIMEPSRNDGYLYQPGIPCSNCTTHCEFFEDGNGVILEGDLCEAPEEDSNSTSTLVIEKNSLVESGSDSEFNKSSIGIFLGFLCLYLI